MCGYKLSSVILDRGEGSEVTLRVRDENAAIASANQ